MLIAEVIGNIIQLYSGLILVWCLLSWFSVRWYEQPWKTLDAVVQPVVAPFRKIIPPISGIDFSPMVAMILLQACGNFVRSIH